MKIKFNPQRSDSLLSVSVNDSAITVNGQVFDFTQLPVDGKLPASAINSQSFIEDVYWDNGELVVSLILPHGIDADESVLFPAPVQLSSGHAPVPGQLPWEGGTTQGVIDWNAVQLPQAAPVPKIVTMRQARLALLGAGLLTTVEATLAALPEPTKTAAQIEWEYSQEVHRDKALVQMLAPLLGLTTEQLDNLFIIASTL